MSLKVFRSTNNYYKDLLILSWDGYHGVVVGNGKGEQYDQFPIGTYSNGWSGFKVDKEVDHITIKSDPNKMFISIDKINGRVIILKKEYQESYRDYNYHDDSEYVIISKDSIRVGKFDRVIRGRIVGNIKNITRLDLKFTH